MAGPRQHSLQGQALVATGAGKGRHSTVILLPPSQEWGGKNPERDWKGQKVQGRPRKDGVQAASQVDEGDPKPQSSPVASGEQGVEARWLALGTRNAGGRSVRSKSTHTLRICQAP